MLRELGTGDREAILRLAYARERESIFIISSLERGAGFASNRYFGWEEEGVLRGVATSFTLWGSFVAVGDSEAVIAALVDRAVAAGVAVSAVPAFCRFAEPTVASLLRHGIACRSQHPSFVYELTSDCLQPSGGITRVPMEGDLDAIVRLQRILHDTDNTEPVTDRERKQIDLSLVRVCEVDGVIVSKAAMHGRSKRYAQIGGVVTHPAYRGRGLAKQCVSALCEDCFSAGVESILLFTAKDNLSAQRVYESLGFVITDDYLLTEY